jgi:hypothetical protein
MVNNDRLLVQIASALLAPVCGCWHRFVGTTLAAVLFAAGW